MSEETKIILTEKKIEDLRYAIVENAIFELRLAYKYLNASRPKKNRLIKAINELTHELDKIDKVINLMESNYKFGNRDSKKKIKESLQTIKKKRKETYLELSRKRHAYYKIAECESTVRDCEDFFFSNWYKILMDVDPSKIVLKIREETNWNE